MEEIILSMQAVSTEGAPKAIGPYSQAVIWNDLVFLSGQVAIDPSTGNIEADSTEAQTAQVMKNLQAVLKASGSDLNKVLRCTVFLTNLEDFQAFNLVYGSFFTSTPPARSTVQVSKLPKGAKVEIDAIAYKSH